MTQLIAITKAKNLRPGDLLILSMRMNPEALYVKIEDISHEVNCVVINRVDSPWRINAGEGFGPNLPIRILNHKHVMVRITNGITMHAIRKLTGFLNSVFSFRDENGSKSVEE